MQKRLLFALMIALIVLTIVAPAYARQQVTARLVADPVSYTGPCPTTIQVKGTITATEAGRVQYKFIRGDGASAPVVTLNFDRPGTKEVTTTWTLGRNYVGWEAIKVIYPMDVESNKANFRIQCGPAQRIVARLTANPVSYAGKCPTTITFKGSITVTEAMRLQYRFIRSDGASAPIQTLNFDRPGTKEVNTTWTLGRSYTGWEAIKVLYPQAVESNKANFSIQCR